MNGKIVGGLRAAAILKVSKNIIYTLAKASKVPRENGMGGQKYVWQNEDELRAWYKNYKNYHFYPIFLTGEQNSVLDEYASGLELSNKEALEIVLVKGFSALMQEQRVFGSS